MPFRETQLGRFGVLCMQYFGAHNDPDIRAAHALANNGMANPLRPSLQVILNTKSLIDINNPPNTWTTRQGIFSKLSQSFSPSTFNAGVHQKLGWSSAWILHA